MLTPAAYCAAYTTAPGMATNIERAGAAIAGHVDALGEHVGHGIVHVGEWFRSHTHRHVAEEADEDGKAGKAGSSKRIGLCANRTFRFAAHKH